MFLFCVKIRHTSVFLSQLYKYLLCVCVFISSVGFDLVCLRLDFKSSHSWSVHFVYKKLPHKVSNCQGPPKVIFGGKKTKTFVCCTYDLCMRACACVCVCIYVYQRVCLDLYITAMYSF